VVLVNSPAPISPADPPPAEGLPILDADLLLGAPSPPDAELESGLPRAIASGLWRPRLKRWTGIFAYFFTAQGMVQASGLLAGLLFVNFLPVEEFALYTLASSALVTLAFLTDLGSSSALLHFFHRSRTESLDYAPYAAAVFSLRRRLFVLGGPVAVVALLVWGRERQFPPFSLGIAALCALAASWFQISGTLSVLSLRLEDRYSESYRAEIGGSLARLGLAGGLVALGWHFGTLALATAVVGAAITSWLSVGGRPALAVPREALSGARRAVVRYLGPTLPGALYFALQGQFVVWLAAGFGGTTNLAQVGALGRLGLLMGLFSGLIQVVFLPQLVRIADERMFRWRYVQFGAFLAGLALALFGAAALFPRLFLMLLGPKYSGLDRELLLVIATSGLSLLGGYAVGVNNARSWNRWQPLAVAILALSQASLVFLLPLGTTSGVLWFGLISTVVACLLQLTTTVVGFSRPRWVRWSS
jgi:O-antigen/teichoic acid export membrane protein